ncbi:MAG: hypothetical protein H7X88_08660, partial [Gloeobacteraceae cyanobacterium ES-bin-316]|nr:hypothetical protein [Ferruginibacter sp.]
MTNNIVLVAGGTGNLGSKIVIALLEQESMRILPGKILSHRRHRNN